MEKEENKVQGHNELGKMIKRIPSLSYDYSKKFEQLILLDLKSEKAFTKRPWQGFLSSYAYYWISTSDYHTVKGRSIELQDMRSGGKVNLSFDYRVKCRRGEEYLVVELVGKTENPGVALEKAIMREIETCAYHKSENFLSNYNSFEQYLKEHMYGWADSNGMSLDIHLTPQLDEPELLEGFEITLGEDKDWELATRDSRIPVRLSISVHGKISSFGGKLGDYLKPGERLLEKIKSVINNVTQQYIHTISPEKFYMQFEEGIANKSSVQWELSTQIKERLSDQFNVEVSALTIRQRDTKLTQRFRDLTAGFGELELKDNSQNIKYIIQYHVERVHEEGWAVFQSKNFGDTKNELNTIGKNLRRHMKLFFDTNLEFDFQNVKNEQLNMLIEKLFYEAAKKIADDFGLVVKLSSMQRLISKTEELLIKQRKIQGDKINVNLENELKNHNTISNAKAERLELLKEQFQKALKAEDEEEANRLEKLINEEEKKWSEGTNLSQKQKKLDGSKNKKLDISDFLGDRKLLH